MSQRATNRNPKHRGRWALDASPAVPRAVQPWRTTLQRLGVAMMWPAPTIIAGTSLALNPDLLVVDSWQFVYRTGHPDIYDQRLLDAAYALDNYFDARAAAIEGVPPTFDVPIVVLEDDGTALGLIRHQFERGPERVSLLQCAACASWWFGEAASPSRCQCCQAMTEIGHRIDTAPRRTSAIPRPQ